MEDIEICRICLATDVKLYCIKNTAPYKLRSGRRTTLTSAYKRMTGVKGGDEFLCFECAALLRKFDEFRHKCQEALVTLNDDWRLFTKEAVEQGKGFMNDPFLMQRRETYFASQLKISHNVAVTSIGPSNLETFPLNNIKPELDTQVQEDDMNNENIEDNFVESDTKSNDLLHNENSSDYITQKKKKKRKQSAKLRVDASFDDTDDQPLSKISKEDSVAILPKKKGPKFDESCFEDFTTVILLTPEDAKKEVEMRKETSNYKNCPYKCNLCYRGFEAQKAYDNHMKKHSSEFGERECECCHLRFMTQKELSKHKFSCHRRKFCCKICPYVCFCTTQAKLHMNLHKGIKYTCEQCGETFSMPNTLFMHKRIKHPTECVCALCGSTFATQRGLQSHNLLLHRQEINNQTGPYCKECNVHFSSETAWKRHLVLSSKHKVSHGCESCGDTFPDAETLKAHTRTHSRKQRTRLDLQLPGTCLLCEKWLVDRPEYKQHVTSEHPDSDVARRIQADDSLPCVCEICGKRFKKPCFLVYHQRQHSGERPYACPTCGKAFSGAGALRAHRQRHRAPPEGHACRLCRSVFRSTSALNKHVKIRHLNLRPHKCSVCGKSFPSKCEAKYHMQYVHCKVPWPKRDRTKAKRTVQ